MRVNILTADGIHYVRAFRDGVLDATASTPSTWETFEMEELDDGRITLRTLDIHPGPHQHVRAHGGGGAGLTADRCNANDHEKFTLEDLGDGKVAIRTHGGNYWRAKNQGGAELDCLAATQSLWEVFTIVNL